MAALYVGAVARSAGAMVGEFLKIYLTYLDSGLLDDSPQTEWCRSRGKYTEIGGYISIVDRLPRSSPSNRHGAYTARASSNGLMHARHSATELIVIEGGERS